VVQANGNELIAVQRTGLSDDQKKKLALYDNRTAELADWDIDVLKDIDIELPEMLENIFQPQELDELLDLSDIGLLEDEDESPEAPEKAVTRPGQIYQLGPHRLMCGDSTDKSQVEKLMNGEQADMVLTDPPYGLNYTEKNAHLNRIDNGNRIEKAIENDAIENYREFFGAFLRAIPFADYNTIYVFMSSQELHSLRMAIEDAGCKLGDYLVWVKNSHVLGRKDYDLKHELILYGWKGRHKFYSGHRTTVIEEDRNPVNDLHPTMKPVALLEKLMSDGSPKEGNIYDPFGGSGSTLIACEKLNRKCHMMEIDPAYCDVIVERYKSLFPEKEVRTLN